MRLGQCFFELGDKKMAVEQLNMAHAFEGDKIFEKEDPKYLKFLKSKIKL